MANGDNSKLTMLIIKWVLSLAGAAIIGLATLGYGTITGNQTKMDLKMDGMISTVDSIKTAINDGDWGDSLRTRDIRDLDDKLERHYREGHRP